MRFSVNVPNFADFADVPTFTEFARTTERAGWDGLFVWDHVVEQKQLRRDMADPWVLLTAAAMATERITLGTMVTPVARRRPQKLAREITTLDRLSGGRMVLCVGLGEPADDEFGSFGEPVEAPARATRLDEGLDVLTALWSGTPVNYRGEYLTVRDVEFQPTPVQRPRVPIWVGGQWPNRAPMRRAARWDGATPVFPGGFAATPPAVEDVVEWRAFVEEQRAAAGRAGTPFEYVVGGSSDPATAPDVLGPLADAGATWWNEGVPFDENLGRAEVIRRRVEQGPPRIDR